MTLNRFSTKELEAEIKRRSEIEIPKQLENPDFTKLRNTCERYVRSLAIGEYDDDSEHYIFEAALVALYGKSVWEFVNGRLT